MSEQGSEVRIRPNTEKYQHGVSGSGSKTLNNGDEVAQALNGCTLDEVKTIASGMGFEDPDKYDHLNVGQRRMNLGNRIRGMIAAQNRLHQKLQTAAEAEDATKEAKAEAKRSKTGDAAFEAVIKPIRREVEQRMKAAEKEKADKAAAAAKAKAEREAKKDAA